MLTKSDAEFMLEEGGFFWDDVERGLEFSEMDNGLYSSNKLEDWMRSLSSLA